MLGLPGSSKLDLCSYIVSFAETTSKKIRDMTSSVNFLMRLRVSFFNLQCTLEWKVSTPNFYLNMLNKVHHFCFFSWTLDSSLKCGQSKSSIGITCIYVRLNCWNWFHLPFFKWGPLVIVVCMIILWLFLDVKVVHNNSFFPPTARLDLLTCQMLSFGKW